MYIECYQKLLRILTEMSDTDKLIDAFQRLFQNHTYKEWSIVAEHSVERSEIETAPHPADYRAERQRPSVVLHESARGDIALRGGAAAKGLRQRHHQRECYQRGGTDTSKGSGLQDVLHQRLGRLSRHDCMIFDGVWQPKKNLNYKTYCTKCTSDKLFC